MGEEGGGRKSGVAQRRAGGRLSGSVAWAERAHLAQVKHCRGAVREGSRAGQELHTEGPRAIVRARFGGRQSD